MNYQNRQDKISVADHLANLAGETCDSNKLSLVKGMKVLFYLYSIYK